MRAHHAHDRISIFLDISAPRNDGHGRINHFFSRIEQDFESHPLSLSVNRIGEVGGIDHSRGKSLKPFLRRAIEIHTTSRLGSNPCLRMMYLKRKSPSDPRLEVATFFPFRSSAF